MDYLQLYEKYLGRGRSAGMNVSFPCFRCDKGESGARHLVVDLTTSKYHCFKCQYHPDGLGRGNALTFARMMGETEPIGPSSVPYKFTQQESVFDQRKAELVYTYLINQMTLTEEDKQQITKERGITNPAAFGVRSCIGAVSLLKNHFSTELLVASGLFYRRKDQLVAHTTISDGRILIPYMDRNKKVTFLRSRRSDQDSETIKYTCPIGSKASKRVWGHIMPYMSYYIITEGELKAMAAVEARIWTGGLPGMGNSHSEIITRLKGSNVKWTVVCFDSQLDGQDNVDHAARALARRIVNELEIPSGIARLPLDARVAKGEKMDIDSYLYIYGPEDLKNVLRKAERVIK